MSHATKVAVPPAPTFAEAAAYWFKLGFISFGGPAGQIALLHQELVVRRCWISERRYLHALNYCMLLPGPEAIQLAIYISWLLHGIKGALTAGALFFLPAFFILCALAGVYLSYGDMPIVQGVFYAIKPAVVAVVLFAAWRIGSRALKNAVLAGIALLSFIGLFFLHIGFPWVVLAAAVCGLVGGTWWPEKFRAGGAHGATVGQQAAALIDDDTPPPPHALFSVSRLVATIFVFVLLWALAMLAIAGVPALVEMGNFFTGAAFLTIGGAYAVLPYVYQGAVEHFGWLSGPQMMDGLALGEATPGPLIMVVTWVGYLGGVAKTVAVGPLSAGLLGAGVATFFTFLPSFMFILAGGPLVEATRDIVRFTAPLTAISAAVVGVIVNLAVFFAWHCFWPDATPEVPFPGMPDVASIILMVLSFISLWRYKVDIMRVIGVCALLGAGLALVRY